MRSFVTGSLLVAGILLAPPEVRAQPQGQFSVLTYNIAGLPLRFSGSNPAVNTPIISCLIRPFDHVNVQEDFNFHSALYDSCDDHQFRSSTTGGIPFGSGLNTLSNLPYTDFTRVKWSAPQDGIDAVAQKGFTLARLRLAEGVYVDVYNLHAQAEVTPGALVARRADILQLATYIAMNSSGNAVIVMGDTNTRYTRTDDNIRVLTDNLGLTDAWVERSRGGSVPELGAPALTQCAIPATGPHCEVVDKVLYRSSNFVTLEVLDYRLLDETFVDRAGQPLSDHLPVAVNFAYRTPRDRRLSDPFGGPHGTAFNDAHFIRSGLPVVVNAISLRAGARLDQVGITLRGIGAFSHGGGGGTAQVLVLDPGEAVTSAELCSGQRDGRTRIFFASFQTSAGRSLAGGTRTNACTTLSAPAGWQLVGFHGRSGASVDKLGLVYAPR